MFLARSNVAHACGVGMKRIIWVLLVSNAIFGSAYASSRADHLGNLRMEKQKRLMIWTMEGDVQLSGGDQTPTKTTFRFGPGAGSAKQRFEIPGLRIVEFSATARFKSDDVVARIRVQCYDARNRVVMELSQPFDPKKGNTEAGSSSGIYFKTQAHTKYLVASIEKTAVSQGPVTVESAKLQDFDKDRVTHKPECNLDEYMLPIWNGSTVHNETVLMVSNEGKPSSGSLLFQPKRVLSVKDSQLKVTYEEGRDFSVNGKVLTAVPGSRIQSVKGSEFPKEQYPWWSVAGKHLCVTYEHTDVWEGPVPEYQGRDLAGTVKRLIGKKPLTVVALGDSITLGINVSGYRGEPPYMPTWAELFTWKLAKEFGDSRIQLFNVGLGGMTARWGEDNASSAVASLNPDLVLIAFGMNDFWSVDADSFRKSIVATMNSIRNKRPKAEFILISSIRFDPIYTVEKDYVEHLTSYAKELQSLAGPGVGYLDMTGLTDYLYKVKSSKDLMSDPMHPDDFLARWYAQSLVAMLDNRQASTQKRR